MSRVKLGEFNQPPPGQPPTEVSRFSGLELEEEGTFQGARATVGAVCHAVLFEPNGGTGVPGLCIERRNIFFLDVLVWVLNICIYTYYIHITYIYI